MTKQADAFRAAIKAEAARLGFEVAHCDLRRGLIHLRRGTEVLGSGAYGRFKRVESAISDVQNIAKFGRRLDRIKGSLYYAA